MFGFHDPLDWDSAGGNKMQAKNRLPAAASKQVCHSMTLSFHKDWRKG